MKITEEIELQEFDFWSGGKGTADVLTGEQFKTIENMLEETNPDGLSKTGVNDFFWFERETIAEWLGFESFEALEAEANEEDTEG